MTTFARKSGRQISPGLSFAAGTLVGAIAVFVPLGPLGHRSQLEGSSRRSQPPAPAAGSNAIAASPASSAQRDSVKPNDASNEATCDVQLD